MGHNIVYYTTSMSIKILLEYGSFTNKPTMNSFLYDFKMEFSQNSLYFFLQL